MEHSCKQSERHVAPCMASGSYTGRFVLMPCSHFKEERTSCPQNPASCQQHGSQPEWEELSDPLAATVQSSKKASTTQDARFAAFFLGLCHKHLPFPSLPLSLGCSTPSQPQPHPPTPAKKGAAACSGSEAHPHSLEDASAFSCLLPWTLMLVQQTITLTTGTLSLKSCQKPVNMDPGKVLLHVNPGALSTVLLTQGHSGKSSRPCHPGVTGE